jgi:hypothetical protein
VDHDAVPEREQWMAARKLNALGGDESLHAFDETFERLNEADQEHAYFPGRQLAFHHDEAHQMQAQFGGHVVRPDRQPDPSQVRGQAGLGGVPYPTTAAAGRHGDLRAQQAALLETAQRWV